MTIDEWRCESGIWRDRWRQLMRDHEQVVAERDRAEATIARVRELATSKSVVGEVRGGGFQYVVVASDLLAAIEGTDS